MGAAVIPLITTLVSSVFALTVLGQFLSRRKPYQLVWGIGLLMYGMAAIAEFLTESGGLTVTTYRLWYLFGAIYVAAYLGMGTVYLLVRRRVAHTVMAVLLAVSVYAAFAVFSTNIDISQLEHSAKIMPINVRLMTASLNIFGTIGLIGGAIWSAWAFWRKRIMPHRVISNVLIAIGAILPAAGGTSLGITGSVNAVHYLLELFGVAIIFLGFLRSKEVIDLSRIPVTNGLKKAVE